MLPSARKPESAKGTLRSAIVTKRDWWKVERRPEEKKRGEERERPPGWSRWLFGKCPRAWGEVEWVDPSFGSAVDTGSESEQP